MSKVIPTAAPKDLSLEGLRGVASLVVALAHVLFILFPYLANNSRPYEGAVAKTVVDAWLIHPPFTLLYSADAAVCVFFVLSGYVLTLKFHHSQRAEVFEVAAARRYIRLVLPAFGSVMFAWALLSTGLMGNRMANELNLAGWPMDLYPHGVSFLEAVGIGLFSAPFFGDPYLNGPLWTLQVELIGSILLFACFALFGRRSLFFLFVWFLFFADILSGRGPGTLYYIALLAGSQLHHVTGWLKRSQLVSSVLVISGLVLIAVDKTPNYAWLVGLPLPDLSPLGPNYNVNPVLFWQVIASTILVAGVIGSRWAARLLSSRIPAYLGRISFSLYLLHMPLLMSFMFWAFKWAKHMGLGYLASSAFAMTTYLLVLVVLAELYTRYVDQASIRLAARLFKSPVPQGTVNLPKAN